MECGTLTIISVCLCFLTDARVHSIPTSYGMTSLNSSRYRRTSEQANCPAPQYPANGQWHLKYGQTAKPGDLLQRSTMIIYECNEGYKLNTLKKYACFSLLDSPDQPTCKPLCPSIYSKPTYTVECKDKDGNNITCDKSSEGAKLYYRCSEFLETPSGKKKKLLTCRNGQWKPHSEPICQAVCGNQPPKIQLLAANAVKATSIEYPWVTALYLTNEYHCGGTLISQSAVLTAAHCVAHENGTAYQPSDLAVGAGKIYRKYQDSREEEQHYTQYINVYHVVVNENYKGITLRYLSDIALLFTEKPFKLSIEVQPVCFKQIITITLHPEDTGEIAGWGINELGTLSDELRILKIPYKSQETCTKELPPDWKDDNYLHDKMCAGIFNQNTSICRGDSGSGLVFKNFDDDKYYIHGVASLSYRENNGECNTKHNSLYTKVEKYLDFINYELSKNIIRYCPIPPYPVNGQWFIAGKTDNNKKVGYGDIFSHTFLTYVCNKGYHLSPSTPTIRCDQEIKPSCELTCPKLQFPSNTIYECQNNGEKINCNEAGEYATLTYVCPEGFTKPPNAKNSSKCLYGSWGDPTPSCSRNPTEPVAIVVTTKQKLEVIAIKDVDKGKEVKEKEIVLPLKICYFNSSKDIIEVDHLTSNLCTHVMENSVFSPEGNLEGNRKLTLIDVAIFVIVVVILVTIVKLIYKFIIFMKNKFFIRSR